VTVHEYIILYNSSRTRDQLRCNFVNWYLLGAFDGEISPTRVLFSIEAWSNLSDYAECHNKRYWSAQNPKPFHGTFITL